MDSRLLHDLSRVREFQVNVNWLTASVYIYGIGSFAQDVKKELEHNGVQILGFIDHLKGETRIVDGLHVYFPDDSDIDLEQRQRSIVILGIHNRAVDIRAIINKLRLFGYNRIISPIDLYDQFADSFADRYWLTSRTFYSAYASEILTVYRMLDDEVSRSTFESIIRFRCTGDYSLLPEPDMQHQYFPIDLPQLSQPIRFIDCGAYDGDTLDSLMKAGYEFQEIAAFEPDQENFHKLSAYIIQNFEKSANAILFPCGVSSSTRQLRFEAGRGEGSLVSKYGSSMIQCVALDECIPTFQPTLIKMDIEGAEMDAIHGAQQMIIKCKPTLAISAYHSPSHIWEIPLSIHRLARENQLEYTYHFRAHAHNCFDTIFYAIPVRKPL